MMWLLCDCHAPRRSEFDFQALLSLPSPSWLGAGGAVPLEAIVA